MKVAASALLVGAASASYIPQQFPLQFPKQVSGKWDKPLQQLQDSLKHMTGEAKKTWDEVAMMFPQEMGKAAFFSNPKAHTRRPDNHWDFKTSGAEVQSVWVENSKGEKERELDGKLENYNLRTKKVDPASLGVDKVKQYSGYLDDEEEDKHLFYCKSHLHHGMLDTRD